MAARDELAVGGAGLELVWRGDGLCWLAAHAAPVQE